jgi:hypothetical protein
MLFDIVFKNLDDPDDKSFEPEAYPVMELEYPNSQASEKSVSYILVDIGVFNVVLAFYFSLQGTRTTIILSFVSKRHCIQS